MEDTLFFQNGNYRLFGIIHSPEIHTLDHQTDDRTGVLICAPFAEEKLISHRILVNLARTLSANGLFSMRFDEMGHGDSEGSFEDATIETRVSDIQAGIRYMKDQQKINKIILLGIRFGATLGALTAQREKDLFGLILAAPILNGKEYFEQLLRSNLTLQMATYKSIIKNREALLKDLRNGQPVNVDGYLLTKNLYEQMSRIDLLQDTSSLARNVLIISFIEKINKVADELIESFSNRFKAASQADVKIKQIKENFFWKEGKIYHPRANNLEDAVISGIQEFH